MPPKKNGAKITALSVLRMITKMVSAMSQEELEALASGKAHLKIIHSSSSHREAPLDRTKADPIDFDRLKSELANVDSTEAALAFLDEASLVRADLERLARSLDLPVLKQDSVRKLEEKIVEALVGSRLNSRAVRGR